MDLSYLGCRRRLFTAEGLVVCGQNKSEVLRKKPKRAGPGSAPLWFSVLRLRAMPGTLRSRGVALGESRVDLTGHGATDGGVAHKLEEMFQFGSPVAVELLDLFQRRLSDRTT